MGADTENSQCLRRMSHSLSDSDQWLADGCRPNRQKRLNRHDLPALHVSGLRRPQKPLAIDYPPLIARQPSSQLALIHRALSTADFYQGVVQIIVYSQLAYCRLSHFTRQNWTTPE